MSDLNDEVLSLEELQGINRAAEEIQMDIQERSSTRADRAMPDEPEPPLSDETLIREDENS
jgi:hypothetical protein